MSLRAAINAKCKECIYDPIAGRGTTPMRLTPAEVAAIRTSGLTDTHWARRLRTTVKTVRQARVGVTHADVSAPPDLIPRRGSGCCIAHRAGIPVRANRRQRWSYFRE